MSDLHHATVAGVAGEHLFDSGLYVVSGLRTPGRSPSPINSLLVNPKIRR